MKNNYVFEISFRSLGTEISCKVVSGSKNETKFRKDSENLKNFYIEKEKIFSRFDPKSELGAVNRNLGKFQKVSKDFLELCQNSLDFYKLTEGYFDPRVIEILENIGYKKDFKNSDFSKQEIKEDVKVSFDNLENNLIIKGNKILFRQRMDFSGIAKGSITDQAGLFLKEKGWRNFLLDSGGDMFTSGEDEFGEKWKISIEGLPEEEFSFDIQNEAVATSGITRRKWEAGSNKFHHLINPKNPSKFDFDLKSVTVVAKNTQEADVWAKVLFLMGRERGIEFSQKKNIRSFFLDSRGNLWLAERGEKKKIDEK
jgi:FAD:protein FMN transferase